MKYAYLNLPLIALAGQFSAPYALAQQDMAGVEIKTEKLADGVYVLYGAGGNIGLDVGADATFLIDDQFAPLSDKIKAAVAKVTPRPVDYLVNTHWHGDHTDGNENFGKDGALIVAQDNVYKRLAAPHSMPGGGHSPGLSKAGLPLITFSQSTTFHINGDTLRVVHVDHAHTDGDAIVHFEKANVIHMGDIYFQIGYPFIDVSTGGNVRGVIAGVDLALSLADAETKIIPGHGVVTDRTELKAYRDMLADLTAKIEPMAKGGKSLQEAIAAKPSAPYDAQYGQAFIKPDGIVEAIYKSLQQE